MLPAKLLLLGVGALGATALVTHVALRRDGAETDAKPPSGVESPATQAPASLTPIPQLTFLPPDPATCDAARASIQELLAWLAEELSQELRSTIEGRVVEAIGTQPEAKAWNDIGIAYYLSGDACAAAWCGLHAVRIQWDPHYVANCGVFLLGANRKDEAAAFLLCAYALGLRSPYLLEALATLHALQNDADRAREYILLADALVPADPLIGAAERLANGADPADADRPGEPRRDVLDVLAEEVRQLGLRFVRTIEALAARLDIAEQDAELKGLRDKLVEITIQGTEAQVACLLDNVRRARLSREEFAAMANMRVGERGFEDSYFGHMRLMRLMAFVALATGHMRLTDEFLCNLGARSLDTEGFHLLFWGEVLDMSPADLGEELRLFWDGATSPGSIRRHDRCQDDLFDAPYWSAYAQSFTESSRLHWDAWHACNTDACRARADQDHCQRVSQAYTVLTERGTRRLNRCAANYHRVAIGRLIEGEREILNSQDFVRRCLEHMVFSKIAAGGVMTDEREMHLRVLADTYQGLIERLTGDHEVYGVAARLAREARVFESERQSQRDRYLGERQNIASVGSGTYGTTNGCPELPAPRWDELVIEPYRVFLEQLRARLQTDFAATARPTDTSCRLRVAYCVVNAGEEGRFSAGLDCVRSEGCGGPFDLVAVSVASDRSGLDASAASTLVTGKTTAGGLWDYSVALTAPANQADNRRRQLFGHLWAIALPCYPETTSPHFAARAVFPGAGRALREALARQSQRK